MKSKINLLLKEIEQKKQELFKEYEALRGKYGFSFKGGELVFDKKIREYNKRFKEGLLKYIFNAKLKNLLGALFIYPMVVPAIFIDICLVVYMNVVFRLYNIELVKRKDFFSYDRKHLDYLNILEKFNCLYCSYFNGLMSYGGEIAGKTERYWCPIKHSRRMKASHSSQQYFADYGDVKGFRELYNKSIEKK
ncbi:hypothetical protein CSB07_00730 [Candidatus Gracilibacteria bacterium]|nr:MAG: hypothetical protein CSB07_00730 [Candidatus Gracilibacteria bacterium]PIE85023.1 MAG: hypothetical protein CSA08_04245 [Candidatus Gracilibacteria bacterium]